MQPLTFPAYAEWSDLEEEACAGCDWSISYGVGGELDAVDDALLSRLEHSSGLDTSANAGPSYGTSGGSPVAVGLGGGGVGGGSAAGGSGAGGAAGTTDEAQAEDTSASESSEPDTAEATRGGGSTWRIRQWRRLLR